MVINQTYLIQNNQTIHDCELHTIACFICYCAAFHRNFCSVVYRNFCTLTTVLITLIGTLTSPRTAKAEPNGQQYLS